MPWFFARHRCTQPQARGASSNMQGGPAEAVRCTGSSVIETVVKRTKFEVEPVPTAAAAETNKWAHHEFGHKTRGSSEQQPGTCISGSHVGR